MVSKKKVGRPSKLVVSLNKAKDYLMGEYKTVGDVVPSVAGLACYLGISRSTAQEYAKENQEFSGTLEAIKTIQENSLINNGLKGDFNPTIVKLMLSNHGYAEKQETALTGKDGGAIETDNKISIEFIGIPKSEGAN
ncbi:DNA-packaging protein [Arsenophonus nasoniae]|uniref:DNA-packaging protein n=1 Tax=Arsenophonus nasoniae TaxID=638 RepID=A0A4P7KVY2_9GAMM|nr:DNA-packaging protein [Arsenophonus nasoniae]QBY44417.1 DNA-packaging protein gp3 [Arsenophonus nasoniae]WGM04676.1 DNA-packaging protein [Arsenophonus nasoniae]WGM09790.1 DNA-packaging protein [Arsenophonus nasoniae]WGM14509.1 DNA-packaging protein [Arsenophonus nasoniae]